MRLFLRQVTTLTVKNLLLAVVRHPVSTPFRAFLLPVVFIAFLSYARNLFIPPSVYGIGTATPIRDLSDALALASGGRNRLVFVNNGFTGGDIESVINNVVNQVNTPNVDVEVLERERDLLTACRSTIRGTSYCIAGAVFFSSPTEGPDGRWNYSIRADAALGRKIVTDSDENDAEIYLLPLQHAVDRAISATVNGATFSVPELVEEYPYTSQTIEQRRERIRIRYQTAIINVLSVAVFIGMVGVTYQLTGIIATEREIGMAQLLDCMMPNQRRWEPQFARILANHIAFDLIYGPGWIVMAIILSIGVFAQTSPAIMIIYHILSGLSLSSFSILGAAFFRKAQLSGITAVIISLLLAIIAQVAGKAGTASVTILSLLFPPMNYVYFAIYVARWEKQNLAANILKSAPDHTSTLPGIVLWVFTIIQIIAFPVLGALIERWLYGTASKARKTAVSDSITAVTLTQFTKLYPPSLVSRIFSRKRSSTNSVLAVDNLSLTAMKGQILVLLGANGSGKSTTLDAVAGLNSISAGEILVNYSEKNSGLGLCPQKNVLWDDLTVSEHIRIFNKIKGAVVASKDENKELLASCDIIQKLSARSKTLSGGQKRKLQLAMMFTGGSSVCCVDEVSSGLDPLSRRKVWDILLAERGRRSIILTTHFLDEADLLADHIAILSKGVLKASGTSVELKHELGSGYRVHVYQTHGGHEAQTYHDTPHTIREDQTVYSLPNSSASAAFLSRLERDGITEYQVSGPTIEDVFLRVAEEVQVPEEIQTSKDSNEESYDSIHQAVTLGPQADADMSMEEKPTSSVTQLLTGKRISMPKQAIVLFRKRWTVFRRNMLPYLAALLVPIIAAGLVTLFLKGYERAGCDLESIASVADPVSLSTETSYRFVAGPRSSITPDAVQRYVQSFGGGGSGGSSIDVTQFANSIQLVDTLDEFNNFVSTRFGNITPGGIFIGDDNSPPTFAWRGNGQIAFSTITQNALSNMLSNVTITNQYQEFDILWAPDTGDALQLITYFGLAMSVYPAFFALYPTLERLRNVRGLHYSNGVRAAPLWIAYTTFDFIIVLITSAISVIIFRAVADIWYHLEYIFVVAFLYGLASTLLSYVISLFSRSQLAAFAFAAAGQSIMFLLYFIAFMCVLTYAPTDRIDHLLTVCHFAIATISPVANLTRALFVALNVFSVTCRDRELVAYPGEITAYGGPILYLIIQSIFLFGLLLWWDSGSLFRRLRPKQKEEETEQNDSVDAEISNELTRVTSSQDGLRVMRISKQFKKVLAVDNVTFGVPKGEVFALLGPNGAGKSTLISLIRGDLQPSRRGGDILVEDTSVIRHRAQARARLGVCPQFDAMDTMTVTEHLDFYARIRGVSDPQHNVRAVIRAVGLDAYADRMAGKLSGGSKRKLSLGIALMGNPSVLLLDEPSSGMDAASKRVMWRTLASVVPGRSLVLTTHSMEEADTLAKRAGILASKMLALGTTDYLRRKHGDAYYVHLVHTRAPHTTDEEMERIRSWVLEQFPNADVEDKVYAGQLRFSVPTTNGEKSSDSSISALFTRLERQKQELDIAQYSVSRATLDQVFLSIVGKHNVEEEGEGHSANGIKKRGNQAWALALCCTVM